MDAHLSRSHIPTLWPRARTLYIELIQSHLSSVCDLRDSGAPRISLTMALAAGSPAPDFTATTHTGDAVTLSGLLSSGNRLLMWFYPRASTGG